MSATRTRSGLLLTGLALLSLGSSCDASRSEPRPLPAAVEMPELDLRTADPAFVETVTRARRAAESQPDSATAWGELGSVLLAHEHHAQAIVALARAESIDRTSPRWPYLLGLALTNGEPDPPRALAAFARAAALAPTAAPALRYAEELLRRGEIDVAEGVLRAAASTRTQGARRSALLGQVAYRRGQLEPARDALRASVRAAPGVRSTRVLLSEILFRLGANEEARLERQTAERLPESTRWPDRYRDELEERATGILVALERANALARRGDSASAIRLLETVISSERSAAHPNTLLARLLLGRLLLESGASKRAIEVLEAAARSSPDSFETRYELARARERQGDRSGAISSYTETLRLKSDYAPAHHALARLKYAAGDRHGALSSLREAVRLRPDASASRKDLGRVLLELGAASDAILELELAQRLAPQDSGIEALLRRARAQSP